MPRTTGNVIIAVPPWGSARWQILGAAALLLGRRTRPDPRRKLRLSAATMGVSILADSAMEHQRGGYHNPAMYVAPTLAALSTFEAASDAAGDTRAGRLVQSAAVVVGSGGFGLPRIQHPEAPGRGGLEQSVLCRPDRRAGRPNRNGSARGCRALPRRAITADCWARSSRSRRWPKSRRPACCIFAAPGTIPAMFTPVTLPPIAAVLLLQQALRPHAATSAPARAALRLMGAMGIVGTGFHIYGVSRNMGGWGNWQPKRLCRSTGAGSVQLYCPGAGRRCGARSDGGHAMSGRYLAPPYPGWDILANGTAPRSTTSRARCCTTA